MSRRARIALLAAGLIILAGSALLLLAAWLGLGGSVIERALVQP